MKKALIITIYNRDALLDACLPTIIRQRVPGLEVMVVDDGYTGQTPSICARHGVGYIDTGHHGSSYWKDWRCPCWAANIGVKNADAEIVMLSCAEIYHIGDCVKLLTAQVEANEYAVTFADCRRDTGHFLENPLDSFYEGFAKMGMYPYLMALRKSRFMEIGGYDEDFTGIARDDDDLIHRLQLSGCEMILSQSKAVHLYHERVGSERSGKNPPEIDARIAYNDRLFKARWNIRVRNIGKNWGILNGH